MSADNWAHCPDCMATKTDKVVREIESLEKKYGVVPLAEWPTFGSQLSDLKEWLESHLDERPDEPTFREDYETYLDGYTVVTDYSGRCSWCGLEVNFTHRHKFDSKRR